MAVQVETYASRPSALRYMLQAFLPSPGWDNGRGFPNLRLSWTGFATGSDSTDYLTRIVAGASPADADKLAPLVPQVSGFRLSMALLTHRRWPLSIWGALQVRNRLILWRPFSPEDRFDLTVCPAAWRVLDKGIEVDLHTRMMQGDLCFWESINTFYYRGRFGQKTLRAGAVTGAAPDAPTLDENPAPVFQGRVNSGARWHFGALTGDYNGIHQWDRYARRFGFKAAFAHPQRSVAHCLARLPPAEPGAVQLDLWIRGPVYYGSELSLRYQAPDADGQALFGVWLAGDGRAALLGSRRRV